MSVITAANSINCQLIASTKLKLCLIAAFALPMLLVFWQTALPLEAKTLLLILLNKELKPLLSSLCPIGTFFIHMSGHCCYRQQECTLTKRVLVLPWLMIFELRSRQQSYRFFVCPDSVINKKDYRHLSRVLLAASLKDSFASFY